MTQIESVTNIVSGGAHFVQIRTDDGLIGTGQGACWAFPEASAAIVDTFTDYLVGQDPLRTEHHWQRLYRMGPFRGSVLGAAVSAVDIALWDIKGQALGVPVWQLLGGKTRDRIRLHHLILGDLSPEDLARQVRASVAEGFTAVKFDPLPENLYDRSLTETITEVRARMQAARDAAGSGVDLLIELHRKLSPPEVPAFMSAIEPFRPLMVEDAIQIDSIVTQAEVAQRMNVAAASGERLHTIWEFRELLALGGSQHVRPDLGLAGGFTHVKKIAAVAEAFHSSVVTHNFLGPVLTAASVHLDATIPNFIVQEFCSIDDETAPFYTNSLEREGGWMMIPREPGLGVRLGSAIVDSSAPLLTPVKPALHARPLNTDGSMAVAI